MPNRIIRDSCRTSPTLDPLSDGAERCFWRLTTTADDYGRFLADPRTVLSACFPLKVGILAVKRVAGWLEEMGRVGLVCFYRVGDRVYGQFVTAEKHFDRRARTSKYPDQSSADICTHVLADVLMPTHASAESSGAIGPLSGRKPDLRTDARMLRTSASTCPQMSASTEAFESSSTEERGTRNEERGTGNGAAGNDPAASARTNGFQIPKSIAAALARAPRLGANPRINNPAYWLAEIRANQGIDCAAEVLRAEAWIEANPKKAPRSDLPRFLHSWLARVDRQPEA